MVKSHTELVEVCRYGSTGSPSGSLSIAERRIELGLTMKRIVLFFAVFSVMIILTDARGQETAGKFDSIDHRAVIVPMNVFDTLTFSKKQSTWIRPSLYVAPSVGMFVYGIYLWDWNFANSGGFAFRPETFIGDHAVSGAADKFGHMYCNYVGTRLLTYFFRAAGESKNKAIIEGAVANDLSSFIGELGDGFSKNYGFDPYDFLFNHFGILLGALLEYSPRLDKIIAMKWEYLPSKRMRGNFGKFSKWDIFTDYNADKFILSTKLGGIPYLSQTPLRYINFDIGYYSRGYYHPYEYPSRTRNLLIGISINYSIAFGDVLPKGYASSALQTFFNYYHPWWDLEVKRVIISDRPHSEF
jgi:hypothetical protein